MLTGSDKDVFSAPRYSVYALRFLFETGIFTRKLEVLSNNNKNKHSETEVHISHMIVVRVV